MDGFNVISFNVRHLPYAMWRRSPRECQRLDMTAEVSSDCRSLVRGLRKDFVQVGPGAALFLELAESAL